MADPENKIGEMTHDACTTCLTANEDGECEQPEEDVEAAKKTDDHWNIVCGLFKRRY